MSRLLFLLLLLVANASADITLPRMLSDGAILQRDVPLKLWGWGENGEPVKVFLNGQPMGQTRVSGQKWQLELPPQPAGGPYLLTFQGNNQVKVSDIYFGDIWIAAGQSNMELPMRRLPTQYPEELASANHPTIRQFHVKREYDFSGPRDDYQTGQWHPATTEYISEFSGVGYFFAKALERQYQVPIGIVLIAVGGSPVEAWMSEDILKEFPEPLAEGRLFAQPGHIEKVLSEDQQRSDRWYQDLGKRDKGLLNDVPWYSPELDDGNWQNFSLPGYWADQSLADENGVYWLRKRVDIPENWLGKSLTLRLGRAVDADDTYINGVKVGNTTYQYPPRRYGIPKGVLKAGENLIAVRVTSSLGKGGFIKGKPYWIGTEDEHISIAGQWKWRQAATAEPLPLPTFIHYKPTGLFNALIGPARHFPVKGVIWYQGESNVTRYPETYGQKMQLMINDWRKHWQQQDMPFLSVQLANFLARQEQPVESGWAFLREQQAEVLELEHTALALAIDVGEWNDIHPLNKKTVGERLALGARKVAYGEEIVYSGPVAEKALVEDGVVTISFQHAVGGVIAKGSLEHAFAIAGKDGQVVWANAEIDGDKVKVWNPEVKQPVSVRYAWADNPNAPLYNQQDLPALPFSIKVE